MGEVSSTRQLHDGQSFDMMRGNPCVKTRRSEP